MKNTELFGKHGVKASWYDYSGKIIRSIHAYIIHIFVKHVRNLAYFAAKIDTKGSTMEVPFNRPYP